jgi:hypothetical protein
MAVDASGRAIFHPWVDAAPEAAGAAAAAASAEAGGGRWPRRAVHAAGDISAALREAWSAGGASSVCVQAGKGFGKSKQIRQFCAELPRHVSVLSVTFRRSLARGVATQLGAGSKTYMDAELPRRMGPAHAPRLTILVNSIWRLDEAAAYDVVVVDEAVSVMEMAGSDLLGEHRRAECCQRLFRLVRGCRMFIFADAMFDAFAVDAMCALRAPPPGAAPGAAVVLVAAAPREAHTFVWYASELRVCDVLSDRVRRGLRIACACMTKHMAVKLRDMVASAFPRARTILYTANGEHDMSDHMARLDSIWCGADVLIFSPVITAGCSFEREHFDDVFLFGYCGTAGVRSAIQMTARVRSVRSKTVHVLIDRYAPKSAAYINATYMNALRERWDVISKQPPSPCFLYDCVRFAADKERAERDALFFEMFWAYVRRTGCATRSEFGAVGARPESFGAPVASNAAIVNECMWGFDEGAPRLPRDALVAGALDAAERVSLPPPNTRTRELAARPWRHVGLATLRRLRICNEATSAPLAAPPPPAARDDLAIDAAEAWQSWSALVSILACTAIIQCAAPEVHARMYTSAQQLRSTPTVWWDAAHVRESIKWACDSFAGWAPDAPFGEAAIADACECAERLCAAALALDCVRDERNKIHVMCRALAEDGPSYLFCELVAEGPDAAAAVCFDAGAAADADAGRERPEYEPGVSMTRALLAAHVAGFAGVSSLLCVRARGGDALLLDAASAVPSAKIKAAVRSPGTNALVAARQDAVEVASADDLRAFAREHAGRTAVGWGAAALAEQLAGAGQPLPRAARLEDPRRLLPLRADAADAAGAAGAAGAPPWRAWAPAKDELRGGAPLGLLEWRRRALASGGAWLASDEYARVDADEMCVRDFERATDELAEEQLRMIEEREQERLDAEEAAGAGAGAAHSWPAAWSSAAVGLR